MRTGVTGTILCGPLLADHTVPESGPSTGTIDPKRMLVTQFASGTSVVAFIATNASTV